MNDIQTLQAAIASVEAQLSALRERRFELVDQKSVLERKLRRARGTVRRESRAKLSRLIIDMHRSNLSYTEIAERLRLTKGVVAGVIYRAGVGSEGSAP